MRGIQYAAAYPSITDTSGILDRPLSRTMTVEVVARSTQQHMVLRSAASCARDFAKHYNPLNKSAQGMPGAQCTRSLVRARVVLVCARVFTAEAPRNHPTFPTQWSYGSYAIVPDDEFLLPPSPRGLHDTSSTVGPIVSPRSLTSTTDARTTRLRRPQQCRSSRAPLSITHEFVLALRLHAHTTSSRPPHPAPTVYLCGSMSPDIGVMPPTGRGRAFLHRCRHCERSEAIQTSVWQQLDCLASLAMAMGCRRHDVCRGGNQSRKIGRIRGGVAPAKTGRTSKICPSSPARRPIGATARCAVPNTRVDSDHLP